MYYEATLLLSPKLAKEEMFARWQDIGKACDEIGGTIKKEIKPIEKTLAYPIKKNGTPVKHAYLGTLYLIPKKEASLFIRGLEELLKSRSEVIRFMISRLTDIPEVTQKISLQKPVVQKEEPTLKPTVKKPSLEELDKKLEEILEDKISF